jgi:hypothetical protein
LNDPVSKFRGAAVMTRRDDETLLKPEGFMFFTSTP